MLAGRDVMGQARTGTGKTAAYGLALLARIDPMLQRTQALVLCPTRELADQIAKEIRRLARALPNIKITVLSGGINQRPQLASLEHDPHIVVGMAGRVQEHLDQATLTLDALKVLVLDEADRMLDLGFSRDIDKLLALAAHYGFMPKACRPYRAKTTDEIEQPYSDLDAILPLLTGDRVAQSGTWRCKPRRAAYDSRASFAAPVGTRLPRLVQPSVRRR